MKTSETKAICPPEVELVISLRVCMQVGIFPTSIDTLEDRCSASSDPNADNVQAVGHHAAKHLLDQNLN